MQNAKFKMQKGNGQELLHYSKRLKGAGVPSDSTAIRVLSHSLTRSLYLAFCIFNFAFCISSCRPSPQYQEHFTVPGGAWNMAYQPLFHFVIDDTASAYQLFLLIRHTDAYPFSNIWVNMDTKAPGDTVFGKVRFEVPLAAPSGQWLGRGFGELYEQRVPITSADRPAFFARRGGYTVRLTHDMRRNPLPEVYNVGLSLEKLPPFKRPGK